jgi:hypothetical protein
MGLDGDKTRWMEVAPPLFKQRRFFERLGCDSAEGWRSEPVNSSLEHWIRGLMHRDTSQSKDFGISHVLKLHGMSSSNPQNPKITTRHPSIRRLPGGVHESFTLPHWVRLDHDGRVMKYYVALITCIGLGAGGFLHLKRNRLNCILNQRNLQLAVRGHQGMCNLGEGAPLDSRAIVGPKGFLKTTPECRNTGPYTLRTTIPKIGVLVAPCSHTDILGKHEPDDFTSW